VKNTQIAASKVLKTFKKRLEKANDERNNPDDCDDFDKANSSVKEKLSHQLHSFLNIFTLIPTEKQLSDRFDEIFEQQILQKKKRTTGIVETVLNSNKIGVTVDLPKTHVVYLKKDANKWMEGNKNYKKIQDTALTGLKYTGSASGKRILAGARAMEPQVSMRGLELIIGASSASMFADAGIKIDPEQLALNVPSANTIKAMILNLASEVMIQQQNILREVSRVYLCCDKGLRKGIDNFIKILSFWCEEKNEQIFMAELAEKVFGTGGIGKRNIIQAVHSAYSLHKCYEFGVFKKLYREARKEVNEEDDDDVRKMQEPVTTRWWLMGVALSDFKKNWNAFYAFSSLLHDSTL